MCTVCSQEEPITIQCTLSVFTLGTTTYRSLIIAAIVMLPILGSTWVIGLFAVNEETTTFAWIFTVLNSLQV